jgi:DNA invertase Pin-like site-specific DNA recombinase
MGEKKHLAGLYLRLSKDDERAGESVSIENQRLLLTKYAEGMGWEIQEIYIDDGWSGTTMQRPAFLRMMRDAEEKRINLIAVKDLSRLGRDYIEVGRYTDEVFPSLGVRFIALMDNIDTEGNSDLLPFRSILNDYHLKDLSRKIKSVLRAKAEAGEYVGAYAPYGYEKDAACPGRLVVDKTAAAVVRRIFDLRLQKIGMSKIASILNGDGILSPVTYRNEKTGKERKSGHGSVWQFQSVKMILTNEAYLGHSVKFKKASLSYKSGKVVDRPEAEHIRVENTHESIISQGIWDEAQAIDLKRYDPAKRKKPEPSLFSGLLVCSDCGGGFCHSTCSGGHQKCGSKVRYGYYNCSLYTQSGKSRCRNHVIYEKTLLKLVREDVRSQLAKISIDESCAAAELKEQFSAQSIEAAQDERVKLETRLSELSTLSAKLYEDRLNGAISLDAYMALSAKAESERNETTAQCDRLSTVIEQAKKAVFDFERWLEAMREYLSFENPDYDAVHDLIEKIEIGAREGSGRGARQNIKIRYRFAGIADEF